VATDEPAIPPLGPDDVHVWRVALERDPDRLARDRALLSPDERRRADRFRFPVHADRFTVSRASLRRILGAYLDVDPARIAFAYGPDGKPRLADPADPLRFNLAHSADVTLVALARGREVGVDLERMRRGVPHQRLARRFFAHPEIVALDSIPTPRREAAFFATWARKEAYVKARGEGLVRWLRRFAVSIEPDEARPRLVVPGHPGEAARWTLASIDAGPGFAAALAVEGSADPRVFVWR